MGDRNRHGSGLDDPGTAEFRVALAQSYVYSKGTELEPFGWVGVRSPLRL
jgi:hypothetical protein